LNLTVQSVTPGRDSLGQCWCSADRREIAERARRVDRHRRGKRRALVHALNKVSHADQLEDQSLNASYFWGV